MHVGLEFPEEGTGSWAFNSRKYSDGKERGREPNGKPGGGDSEQIISVGSWDMRIVSFIVSLTVFSC